MARDVEVAMGKPKGWMDTAHFLEADLSVEAKEAGQIIMSMDPAQRDATMTLLRKLNENSPKRSAGNPFGPIPRGGKPSRAARKRGRQ